MTGDKTTAFLFLVGFFMLLTAPFASVLLFSHVRDKTTVRQRVAWLILILFIVPTALANLLPHLLKSNYLRFIKKDQDYHFQFAQACDALLSQHPIGTNKFVSLAVNDVSLSKVIRDWRPSDATIIPRGVEIVVAKGNRANFFRITWLCDEEHTNVWTLVAGGGEAPERDLYCVTNAISGLKVQPK